MEGVRVLGVLGGGRGYGMQHYPMPVPGSGNFGTVKPFLQQSLPSLGPCRQVIQQLSSRLNTQDSPGWTDQVDAALRMIHSLTGKEADAVGGFRIGVTVKAKSLRDAHRFLKATSFVDPHYWLRTGFGPHAPRN